MKGAHAARPTAPLPKAANDDPAWTFIALAFIDEPPSIYSRADWLYKDEEQGDHFLAFKNSVKFTKELRAFLER